MKTEKELLSLASGIGSVLAEKKCNVADVWVIIGMMTHDVFRQMDKVIDKKKTKKRRGWPSGGDKMKTTVGELRETPLIVILMRRYWEKRERTARRVLALEKLKRSRVA